MKLWIAVITISIVLGLVAYYHMHPLSAKVEISGIRFDVEVAATETQKRRGLSGREHLGKLQGMIFPYDHKEQYEFWMKDMRIPLDVIWIADALVADITKNVPAPKIGERPAMMRPRVPVDTVLEVRAGVVDTYGIQIGDAVRYIDR